LGDVGSDLVFLWSHLPESNRRPFHYEWNALPTELRWPARSFRRARIYFTAQRCFLANYWASVSAAGACWCSFPNSLKRGGDRASVRVCPGDDQHVVLGTRRRALGNPQVLEQTRDGDHA